MSFLDELFDLLRGLSADEQKEPDNSADVLKAGPYDGLFDGLRRKQPLEGFMDAIRTWEGGFQAMPEDVGNWVRQADGRRVLVGTNRGVTPAALALHRGVPVASVTREDMKALTLEEAAEIGVKHYYHGPGFDRLPYVPVTEVWVDIGWGSGPVTAIKHLQLMLGTGGDGVIGPRTVQAFVEWVRDIGHEETVEKTRAWRKTFYTRLTIIRPSNQKFLKGWHNRADYYSTRGAWWASWQK